MHQSSTLDFISIQSSAAKEKAYPEVMQGPAEVPHQIADAHLLRRLRSLRLRQRLTLL